MSHIGTSCKFIHFLVAADSINSLETNFSKKFFKKKMKFLLDSGWESPAIYRTIPGEASLSEEEDDPLESTSCFLYCLLFCTPALSGESSDPLLLSPSYNTFNIYTFCILTGDVIFKKGVKLSFIYTKQ